MPTTDPVATDPVATCPAATGPAAVPALEDLRRPIRDYAPETAAGRASRAAMLGLADLLEELWAEDGQGDLEADVIWTALQAFPGLVASGPTVEELADLTLGGRLVDGETAETLYTLGNIQCILEDLETPGFAAALLRAALIASYRLMAVFVVFDNGRGIELCRQLLDTAERTADSLAGRV